METAEAIVDAAFIRGLSVLEFIEHELESVKENQPTDDCGRGSVSDPADTCVECDLRNDDRS